jgi:hypothetical protein
MDARQVGLIVVAFGVVAVLVGVLIAAGALSWFGRLPGDLHWESGNTRVYVPITTMLIVSVVVSLALYIVRWFR